MDVKTGLIIGLIAVIIGGVIISKGEKHRPMSLEETGALMKARSDCYERGVKYYTEIGSYPHLSTGESALTVINQKCFANPGMFK